MVTYGSMYITVIIQYARSVVSVYEKSSKQFQRKIPAEVITVEGYN